MFFFSQQEGCGIANLQARSVHGAFFLAKAINQMNGNFAKNQKVLNERLILEVIITIIIIIIILIMTLFRCQVIFSRQKAY